MTNSHVSGWGGDHVGKLVKLQAAVRTLAEGGGNFRDRMERATESLIRLRVEDFPAILRTRAERVLALRANAVLRIGDYTHFRFSDMTPTERKRFAADLLALYEGCLIDIGRGWP